jgi:hypothetical protein
MRLRAYSGCALELTAASRSHARGDRYNLQPLDLSSSDSRHRALKPSKHSAQ